MSNKVATTVKVENTLYDQFKIFGIRHKLTLQGLVEKTIYRYVNEDAFRNEMNEFVIPVATTGSAA
jgi:predicted DNA-binding ribbon-helix-helix protein